MFILSIYKKCIKYFAKLFSNDNNEHTYSCLVEGETLFIIRTDGMVLSVNLELLQKEKPLLITYKK